MVKTNAWPSITPMTRTEQPLPLQNISIEPSYQKIPGGNLNSTALMVERLLASTGVLFQSSHIHCLLRHAPPTQSDTCTRTESFDRKPPWTTIGPPLSDYFIMLRIKIDFYRLIWLNKNIKKKKKWFSVHAKCHKIFLVKNIFLKNDFPNNI